MRHIKTLSRTPLSAQSGLLSGGLNLAETLVMMLLGIFFRNWDNYAAVSRNLQKFYSAV
ncbi:MAG TPA: hypothetical protein PKZ01_12060 [Candidatus Hydrogenedentes bacterium]|nr:hypothetical protein [Candidatus Hydrogenedentota bacterium]